MRAVMGGALRGDAMERLFDFESSILDAVAAASAGTVDFQWGTAILFVVVALGGMVLSGIIAGNVQERTVGTSRAPTTGDTLAMSVPAVILVIVLFWVLTGRFVWEYILVALAIGAITQIFYWIVDSFLGVQDEAKREKVHLLPQLHISGILGCLILVLLMVNLLVVLWSMYSALMASFRTDLGELERHARVAVYLFAVPSASGFLLLMPTFWSNLSNKYLDADVRGYTLARALPLSLVTAIMLAFPAIMFERVDAAQSFIAYLPDLDDMVWLPAALFGIFGLLPFLFGAVNHRQLVAQRYTWRSKWLTDLSEAVDNEVLMERQRKSLIDEMNRMIQRTPYFENYLHTVMRDHYPDRAEFELRLPLFDFQDNAEDEMQLAIINEYKTDLYQWDRLTAYLDDLFLYFHTLEERPVDSAQVQRWIASAERTQSISTGMAISPLGGIIITALVGQAFSIAQPYIEDLVQRIIQ